MGFKILLKDPDAVLQDDFEFLTEDTTFSLASFEKAIDWQSAEAIDKAFGRRPPKVAINILTDGSERKGDVSERELTALASVCEQRNIPLIHVSSFEVFGEVYSERGWRESDEPAPESKAGKMLLSMESVAARLPRHLIVRTGWTFEGKNGGLLENFIPPMLRGDELVASDHRYGSPIPKRFLSRALFAMSQQILCGSDNWGVFHLHSADKCSEAEFADQLTRLLVNEFKLDVTLPAIAGVDDERHVMSGGGHLLGRRCTANFGIQLPTWRSGFARVVKSWLDEARASEVTGLDETKVEK